MKSPIIIIPREHQAAPSPGQIYFPHQIDRTCLYQPNSLLSGTELSSVLKVEKSPIHGLGLFASKIYQLHDPIWHEALQGRSAKPEEDGPLRWTNHSDDPNSVLVLRLEGQLEASLIALRKINVGDEITYNYNVFGHTGYSAACNSHNSNCRGSFVLRTEWGENK